MNGGTAGAKDLQAAIVAALPRLRRFCHALAGGAADGDDLMQSTVERALGHLGQFVPGTRVDSWMFRIAQNLNIDRARAVRRRGLAVPVEEAHGLQGEDGRQIVEGRSELAVALGALATVPDDQRAAFALVVIEGLSYREAADVLDVPIGTIMSRIARARTRLHHALQSGGSA